MKIRYDYNLVDGVTRRCSVLQIEYLKDMDSHKVSQHSYFVFKNKSISDMKVTHFVMREFKEMGYTFLPVGDRNGYLNLYFLVDVKRMEVHPMGSLESIVEHLVSLDDKVVIQEFVEVPLEILNRYLASVKEETLTDD